MSDDLCIDEELDSWYREMGERIEPKIEDKPFVGLMEWVDIMVEYKNV